MKAVKTIVIGAVGVAALVGAAAPAAAQYYPNPGYGGYGQYGYPPNVIGQVLQSILNPYGQFGYQRGVNPQVAVQQCTSAVQQRLQYQNRGGYGGYGYGQYGQYGYGNAYSQARVLGITRVEQRSASTLRVRGVATSGIGFSGNPYGGGYGQGGYGGYGGYGQGGYGGYGGYGYAQPQSPDLIFRCDVDYRGYIRDIDIDRID